MPHEQKRALFSSISKLSCMKRESQFGNWLCCVSSFFLFHPYSNLRRFAFVEKVVRLCGDALGDQNRPIRVSEERESFRIDCDVRTWEANSFRRQLDT